MKKRMRSVPVEHAIPARLFRVRPDPRHRHVVEVRISRYRWHMHDEVGRFGGRDDFRAMGLVRCYSSTVTRDRRCVAIQRGPAPVVARVFLNVRDLRRKPSEIVAHECTHAGMAWARLRRVNLRNMPGEEVLCHAVGQLVMQVNRICYAHGVWQQ